MDWREKGNADHSLRRHIVEGMTGWRNVDSDWFSVEAAENDVEMVT